MVFPCLHVTESRRRWKLRSALIEGKGQEREHARMKETHKQNYNKPWEHMGGSLFKPSEKS